jgi:cyclohexa-1,5-dienecarbonyl-CoA hydratase
MSDFVQLIRERDCVTLTLNRPPRNVLDIATLANLRDKLGGLADDRELRFVVFTSAVPGTFSAGNDIADHTVERAPRMLETFHDIFRTLSRMNVVTVAAVDGVCLGGGAELALFCDFVIAGEHSRFAFPEINVGCFPPVAAALLPLRIGTPRALRWILTGDDISLDELRHSGLLFDVVASGEVSGAARRIVETLRSKSVPVCRYTAELVCNAERTEFMRRLVEAENVYLQRVLHTHDASEGVQAFLQKRKPVWEHERS